MFAEGRPKKRRRISADSEASYSPTFQQIILEEIDLEVAIRKHIADTVQSRIAWALLLQESLSNEFASRSDDIRSASLDALDAIEAPCELLFDREVRLAPPPLRPLTNVAVPSNIPPADTAASTVATSRSTRTRGLPRVAPAPRGRLLYIRNTATNPPEIAKLACRVCARSDFSKLQGLLNHCRLRHKIEFGSHDECIQSCAVLVSEDERDWVVAYGTEVGDVSLPSLRRLFEIAVGAGEKVVLQRPDPEPAPANARDGLEEALPSTSEIKEEVFLLENAAASVHVTKTLGYHADTPALAPFLGRAPKKRRINVRANEDDFVNIDDYGSGTGSRPKRVWRKPYAHRNVARKELDEVVPLNDPNKPTDEAASEGPLPGGPSGELNTQALQALSGTRFHINARVQVADYSLFIPQKRRPVDFPEHTHRWRLAVTSPSYSLPIASILKTLTVECVTDPAPSTFAGPIALSGPPFVLTNTTDKPFLARLKFTWAGTMNPPTEVDHWVELDPAEHANPVLGDEQVFDVELDRSTELLPLRDDMKEVTLEDMHIDNGSSVPSGTSEAEEPDAEPEYSAQLRSLLPQFPIILKDVKGRFSSRLSYTLIHNPAQFRDLHYGRRKAIEMSRARALREAYSQQISERQDPGAIPLTTVDVFHWLEDEGFYPRTNTAPARFSGQQSRLSRRQHPPGALEPNAYCRTCGLHRAHHPNTTDEDTKPAVDIKPALLGAALERGLCTVFNDADGELLTQRPIFDVDALLKYNPAGADAGDMGPYGLGHAIFMTPSSSISHPQVQTGPPSPEDLVSIAHPQLTVAIQRATGLPHLQQGAAPRSPSRLMDLSHSAAAAHLAPSALLAVALRSVVRQLVGRGVDALREDEAALRVATGRHERPRRATAVIAGAPTAPRRVLTPAHVLRGVAARARSGIDAGAGLAGDALRVCLARLGERSVKLRGEPRDGRVHIRAGAQRTGMEEEGRASGDAPRGNDSAIVLRPGVVLPGDTVVKVEEE
ncbi:hypothetical protein C8Q79DRAFT_906409 [Trametes meyenii]|nr:hypothetical protein C8Q79DRAFT_906409 [Trametes meyenii]